MHLTVLFVRIMETLKALVACPPSLPFCHFGSLVLLFGGDDFAMVWLFGWRRLLSIFRFTVLCFRVVMSPLIGLPSCISFVLGFTLAWLF